MRFTFIKTIFEVKHCSFLLNILLPCLPKPIP